MDRHRRLLIISFIYLFATDVIWAEPVCYRIHRPNDRQTRAEKVSCSDFDPEEEYEVFPSEKDVSMTQLFARMEKFRKSTLSEVGVTASPATDKEQMSSKRGMETDVATETTTTATRTGAAIPTDHITCCQDLYKAGIRENGVYTINPKNWPYQPFDVYCNMTDGGGWTVFQRRIDGTEDFFNDWATYKKGFGNLTHEFWLGNDKLYHLTNQRDYQIRIDLVNRDGAPYYAKFTYFRINNEDDNYRLTTVGVYSGTADDQSTPDGRALTMHGGYQFSTKDRDNDVDSSNCAESFHGAWWYTRCLSSNLNGDYHVPRDDGRSIYWENLPGPRYNVKYTEMKIRPV